MESIIQNGLPENHYGTNNTTSPSDAAGSTKHDGGGPTYNEAFPPLGIQTPTTAAGAGPWRPVAAVPSIKSYNSSLTVCIPYEERRFKDAIPEQQKQSVHEIMQETNTTIDMSLARDRTLTVIISGREDRIAVAHKSLLPLLQTQASIEVMVPKQFHRFILGKEGKRLKEIEANTTTRISIPKDGSDLIKVFGTREGIMKAKYEIMVIYSEQDKLDTKKLTIHHAYHPFISGPNNETLEGIIQATGARIIIPPQSKAKDEIIITGEKNGVQAAVVMIENIYNEKKRHCQTIELSVQKSQHRHIVMSSGIQDIFNQTGVVVIVPPAAQDSNTITMLGEPDQLGKAINLVMAKANSHTDISVDAHSWMHRYIRGTRRENITRLQEEYPKVRLVFNEAEEKIKVSGPTELADKVAAWLEKSVLELKNNMTHEELEVDAKYHPFIIGKGGSNINRIKETTKTSIIIPSGDESPNRNLIVIDGKSESVAAAKAEIMEIVQKTENYKVRQLSVEQRLHRLLIGTKGDRIKEVREKFPDVLISFPGSDSKSDLITLRGQKDDVDKAVGMLKKIAAEVVTANYRVEVPIMKQFHGSIIGKSGATIKKIKDETQTEIEIPSEKSQSDIIVITGYKQQVEKAKNSILAIQNELASTITVTVDIPSQYHQYMIGAKGRIVRSIMEECGGVHIQFPTEGTNSNRVTVRGTKEDAEKAKAKLLELAHQRQEYGYIEEISVKPEYVNFLIGRNGININRIRSKTGALIAFPLADDREEDQGLITIAGKEEDVMKAKAELSAMVERLKTIVQVEMSVDTKHHAHFLARRAVVLNKISRECGGVSISFPRSDSSSTEVVIKGPHDCVDEAQKRIHEVVADLELTISTHVQVPKQYHGIILGSKGSTVQLLMQKYDVNIRVPRRNADAPPYTPHNKAEEGGSTEEEKPTIAEDEGEIITIIGRQENCDAARDAILDLIPQTETIEIPQVYHGIIIGAKGAGLQRLTEGLSARVEIPNPNSTSDLVKVVGKREDVAKLVHLLQERVTEIEKEEEDRKLRRYQMEVDVKSSWHSKLIGKNGAAINRIRQKFSVQFTFPNRNTTTEETTEATGQITITGYEEDCKKAAEAVLAMVAEWENMTTIEVEIDHRIHNRLIGTKGKNVRAIRDQFKVDIAFPRAGENPDVVIISGADENIQACQEHLMELQELYLEDVIDRESHVRNSRGAEVATSTPTQPPIFNIRDAPWTLDVDVSSQKDFPDLSNGSSLNFRQALLGKRGQ